MTFDLDHYRGTVITEAQLFYESIISNVVAKTLQNEREAVEMNPDVR